MADLDVEKAVYERDLRRFKKQQKAIEKAKKKWQSKVEKTDWFDLLNKGEINNEPAGRT